MVRSRAVSELDGVVWAAAVIPNDEAASNTVDASGSEPRRRESRRIEQRYILDPTFLKLPAYRLCASGRRCSFEGRRCASILRPASKLTNTRPALRLCALVAYTVCLVARSAAAQGSGAGHAIGAVTTRGDLIVVELDRDAVSRPDTFDLVGRTLRFVPTAGGYRVQNIALRWSRDVGHELSGGALTLHRFAFPFSRHRWTSLRIGTTGSIRFGALAARAVDPYGHAESGLTLDRFAALADVASALVDSAPAICVFLKPRLTGPRYVKELADRVVITWDLTEPYGGILDFHWFRTTDRFQAVLHRDGGIEMSYQRLSAKDGIVGVYPALLGTVRPVASLAAHEPGSAPAHLDLRAVTVSVEGGAVMRAAFVVRGGLPAPGAAAVEGTGYRIRFDALADSGRATATVTWTVNGMRDPYNPDAAPPAYVVAGPGALPNVTIAGDTLALRGVLPSAILGAKRVRVTAAAMAGAHDSAVTRLRGEMRLANVRDPSVHFASLTARDAPFPMVYEAFHYAAPPRAQDLACTVIGALGDNFDFLVYYSNFRIDSQESSSPSFGPAGGDVTGIGQTTTDDAAYCSSGRFQWAFAQPVSADANETWERPPRGVSTDNVHDIGHYLRQLGRDSAAGRPRPFDYAMSHIGHEMAHRWSAYVSANVGGRVLPLGPWPHWGPGLDTRAAFPYDQPVEASTVGGGVWQDNGDRTFTHVRDGYFVPAPGYSYLDLYLMGFVSPDEVPDFFVLDSLTRVGSDSLGRGVFRAHRTGITIQDVTAAQGARVPDAAHSQRQFNTGFVVLVEHGQSPAPELLRRVDGIRRQWMIFWDVVTGHRASMTTVARPNPK